MKTAQELRRIVMKTAWQIFRRSDINWKSSMKKAWSLVKATLAMAEGIVEFWYRKVDGTLRHAVGTLHNVPYSSKGKKGTKSPYSTVCYWDVEQTGFRSFRVENFQSAAKSV